MQFQITDFLKIKQRHIESTGLGFLHKVHQYLSPHGLSPRSCRLVKICIPLENMDHMHPVNKQVLSYHLNRQQNMRKEKSPMIQYLKLDLKIQFRHCSLGQATLGPGYKGEALLTKQRLQKIC